MGELPDHLTIQDVKGTIYRPDIWTPERGAAQKTATGVKWTDGWLTCMGFVDANSWESEQLTMEVTFTADSRLTGDENCECDDCKLVVRDDVS